MKIGDTNRWRETQRPARFMFLDARIVVFAALALLHFRIWTLALLACAAAALFLLERRGINPRSIPLFIRSWLLGPEIPARPPGEERYSVDYGFELRDPAIRRELAQAAANSASRAGSSAEADGELVAAPSASLSVFGNRRSSKESDSERRTTG